MRVLVAVVGIATSLCVTSVAQAQQAQPASWDVNLQARGVTPTSPFAASARFFAPARHRFHGHRGNPHYQEPPAMPYQPYAPPPDGYVLHEKANRVLVWSGALLFGIPYAGGLTYSVLTDFPGHTEYLAIPVVGPWLARKDEKDKASRVVLGLNGLAQATGAVLLTLGFTLTRKEWVPYQMGNVWVTPAATAREVGMVAGGVF